MSDDTPFVADGCACELMVAPDWSTEPGEPHLDHMGYIVTAQCTVEDIEDAIAEWQARHPDRKPQIPFALRWEVWLRDDFRCQWCGWRRDLTADHIIPWSLGGPTKFANLQTLCRSCNSRKGVRVDLHPA